MKIRILSLIAFFTLIIAFQEANAQSGLELGLRAGEQMAIDATLPIAAKPRLHPTVYFSDTFGVGAYFDWMFQLEGEATGLKFYPGVGPELWFGDELEIGAAGNFGAEYTFDFPLTVGFDWRPSLIITEGDFLTNNWGFTARFRFTSAR